MIALYIFPALAALCCYQIPSPLDLLLTLSAFALNLLGDFLAIVTGATKIEIPFVYSSNAFDPELYCWSLVRWIWKVGARVAVCCALLGLVLVATILVLRVCSWLFSSFRRMKEQIKITKEGIKIVEEESERLRAQTLAHQNRWKARFGFTDQDVARVMGAVRGGDDGAAHARFLTVFREVAARREEERIMRLREQGGRLRRRETWTVDHDRRLRGGEARRTAELQDLQESIVREEVLVAALQVSIAKEHEHAAELREQLASVQRRATEHTAEMQAWHQERVAEMQERIASEHEQSATLQEEIDRVQNVKTQGQVADVAME
jgi:hypothetical protein